MKNLALLCSLFIILLFMSCNQNEPTSPSGDDQKSGKLFLKIDKANAPQNVVWVEAFLSRQGFDTMSNSMNILSDTTADLLIEEVQAGEWHLRVDAKDSTELVLYSGETDVQIFAGFTTQVNLVLEPTGAGVGNIYIQVTWGNTPPGNWLDFEGNPVLLPTGNYWDYSGVSQAKILMEGNLLKMFYTSQGSAYSGYTDYAYSNDGINWSVSPNNPVLSPGPGNTWDATATAGGTPIKVENGYIMYYTGWSDPSGPWHIGLATSPDGINWIKHPNPVLYASGGPEFQIVSSSIIKIDNVYYLYYNGRNLPYQDIRLATSPDGINWTKFSGNPILTFNQGWEGPGVYNAHVYEKNGQYEMIYMNQLGTGFGKATSIDGINWTKDGSNPFFTKDQTHNHWADYKIAYPYFIRINNHDRIYYTGFSNYGPYRIGFMSK
jgi:predicted GH43/DUF377 family glycosyl hydrolase